MNTSRQLHVAIVLDRSGSMNSCRQDAIGAVNAYLAKLREGDTRTATVTIIFFDSESIDLTRDGVTAAVCPDIEASEYEPRALTPLLDAVGHAVSLLDQRGSPEDGCFLAIMTDGLENASKEYTGATIAQLLKARQEAGWSVIYLGADHDAWAAAEQLGIERRGVAPIAKGSLMQASFALAAASARMATGERRVGLSETDRFKLNPKEQK